jgi:glucose-1-phosphate thymidylyltransferase
MDHIAVLLCAGFGTRLGSLPRDLPQPLLRVAGRPALDYLMDQLVTLPQLNRIVLVTNAKFSHHFQHWEKTWLSALTSAKISLRHVDDGALANENRLGACADLQLALRAAADFEAALVSAGDNIYLFSIHRFWKRFLEGDHHCLFALPEKRKPILRHSGVPVFGDDSRVLAVHEKPREPAETWLCPPLYLVKPAAHEQLDRFLKDGGRPDAPGHFIDYLCRNDVVHAFRIEAGRVDIGTPAAYRRAQKLTPTELDFRSWDEKSG